MLTLRLKVHSNTNAYYQQSDAVDTLDVLSNGPN